MPVLKNFKRISWCTYKQYITRLLLIASSILTSIYTCLSTVHKPFFYKQPLLYNQDHYGWDWKQINTKNIQFPKQFLWGVAMSEYQYSGASGCPKSNWATWEQQLCKQHPTEQHASYAACNFWKYYQQDIQAAHTQLGINSLRFSVDWSIIEPHHGHFNEKALAQYKDLCVYLHKLGITPMVTLHHFVHPQWFEKCGAFERVENIIYFVQFCTKVFQELSPYVKLWCTINEPTIYAFQGYIRKIFPPGIFHISRAATVLKNLLQAHYCVYTTLKQLPHGSNAQIGLVHQYLTFQPYNKYNPLDHLPGLFFNNILNTQIVHFCKTGHFSYRLPCICNAHFQAPTTKIVDFIGLNYYSRALTKFQLNLKEPFIATCYPHEMMTDMPYAIYAEGLCSAIDDVSTIGVPIYITENGIATNYDKLRKVYLKRHLFVLSEAIKAGYDIRGYYYWSLLDNFEWDQAYKMRFGLYSVDFTNQKRTIKPSAYYLAHVINSQI